MGSKTMKVFCARHLLMVIAHQLTSDMCNPLMLQLIWIIKLAVITMIIISQCNFMARLRCLLWQKAKVSKCKFYNFNQVFYRVENEGTGGFNEFTNERKRDRKANQKLSRQNSEAQDSILHRSAVSGASPSSTNRKTRGLGKKTLKRQSTIE